MNEAFAFTLFIGFVIIFGVIFVAAIITEEEVPKMISLGYILAGMCVFSLSQINNNRYMEKAIELGVAHYDSKTGDFVIDDKIVSELHNATLFSRHPSSDTLTKDE